MSHCMQQHLCYRSEAKHQRHLQVLTLPPCPHLSDKIGSVPNSKVAILKGCRTPGFRDGWHPLRASMLSHKDDGRPRCAVMVHARNDPFWDISSAEELYSVLERAFPQVCVGQRQHHGLLFPALYLARTFACALFIVLVDTRTGTHCGADL